MPLMQWVPGYSVHNDELDSHHQKMFDIMNTLYEDVMNSQDLDSIERVIDELSVFVSNHMAAEERHMWAIGYPDIAAHIEAHKDLPRKIEMLRTDHHATNLEATRKLIIMLGNWLLNHVIKEDLKYSTTHLPCDHQANPEVQPPPGSRGRVAA